MLDLLTKLDDLLRSRFVKGFPVIATSTMAIVAVAGASTGFGTPSGVLSEASRALGIPTHNWLLPAQEWIADHHSVVSDTGWILFLAGLTFTYGHHATRLKAPVTSALGATIMLEAAPEPATWWLILGLYAARLAIERLLERWQPSASAPDVVAAHMVAWFCAPLLLADWLLGRGDRASSASQRDAGRSAAA